MRCKNCDAFVPAIYFESYDPYQYEYCQILDMETDERFNGNECGEISCSLHYKTIENMLKEIRGVR